jgi:hypothetical protein
MKFEEIKSEDVITPGQHLYYIPKQTIVLCTAFTGETIKAFMNGRLMEDKVAMFKKVLITKQSRKNRPGGCKGCGR